MEELTPSTPVTVTGYRVLRLILDWGLKLIEVKLRHPLGHEVNASYEGTEAEALMIGLNKADLSTNSLHRRILQRLMTDGKIENGSVTGTPD